MPEFETPPTRCDFCSNHETRWRYPCPDFSLDVPSLQGWHSDGDWAACDPCSTLIEAGQWDALATRSQKHLNRLHPDGKLAPTQVKGSLAIIHQGFRQRRSGPRQAQPVRDRPFTEAGTYSRALDERDKLYRSLLTPGLREHATRTLQYRDGKTNLSLEEATKLVDLTYKSVSDAEVGFVSRSVCRILAETADSIPEVTVQPEQLPTPSGFLVLQEPYPIHAGLPSEATDTLISAGPVVYLSWRPWRNNQGERGLHVIGWLRLDDGVNAPVSVPWQYGQTWAEAAALKVTKGDQYATERILRYLAALLAFCEQQLIVSRPGVPERATRRRLEREGKLVSDILVVELRRVQIHHDSHGEEHRQIAQDFSFLVSGHWRRQPYPSTKTVRAIWIKPTIKGNRDAPLRARTRVFAIVH
jgi:hypothetical protein